MRKANVYNKNIKVSLNAGGSQERDVQMQEKVEGRMSETVTYKGNSIRQPTVRDGGQGYSADVPINDISQTYLGRHALSLLTELTSGGACESAYQRCSGRLTPLMVIGILFRELQIESKIGSDDNNNSIED